MFNCYSKTFSEIDICLYIALFVVGVVLLYSSKIFHHVNSFLRLLYFRLKYDFTTNLAKTEEDCVLYTKQLIDQCKQFPVLGLDCEWVSNGKQRGAVALLQLASPRGCTTIFRLNQIKNIPPCLLDLLNDNSIMKVGVSIVKDGNHLTTDYGMACNGFLDLRYVAGCGDGLAKLCQSHLGIALDKDWRVRASNWEAQELTARQIDYAAQDARVAVLVFTKLNYRLMRGKTWYWNQNQLTDNEIWDCTYKYWFPYLDRDYTKTYSGRLQTSLKLKHALPQAEIRKFQTRSYSTRKKPLYDNIFLQAPDGETLCTCNIKKVEWYESKGLGKWVSDNPKYFRLFFEPAGRDATGYYSKEKLNICVVCGTEHTYLRKYIVPLEYKKHFPVELKTHQSHDVLLLCLQCHMKSNIAYNKLKDHLATLCDAPFTLFYTDFEFYKAVSAARALDNNSTVIPDSRKEELKAVIQLYLGQEEITEHDIKQLLKSNEHRSKKQGCRKCCTTHGWKVVQYFKHNPGGIQALERLWRKDFVETMQPKHLPQLWSTNYNHYLS